MYGHLDNAPFLGLRRKRYANALEAKRKLPASADSTSSLEDFALDNYHQNPDGLLDDVQLEKLDNLKKAVTARTYHVSADEVAGKLIVHMLKLGMCRSPIDAGISPENGGHPECSAHTTVLVGSALRK
jgi:anti-sigma28 factor (negative regulator of flagellin synthesis)